uniref:Globin family profile domain-containing protein n=1 Tax=Panagrolaimus sp. JU765 TaxID=591449 RepID=A0AC34RQD9_9BILA
MFRFEFSNSPSVLNAPINFAALNPPPTAAQALAALDRPQGLKISHVVAAKKCIDDKMEQRELQQSLYPNNRIGADSRSESHKEVQRLDAKKRKIICESYVKVKDGGWNNGLMVFIRMFAENPQFKNIWPQFRAITDSSLISSEQLRNHAKIYFGGMNSIVTDMSGEDETEFRNLMRRMARSHAKYGVNKKHIMAMLPEFLSMLRSSGVDVTPEVEEAWSTMFDVIGNLVSKLHH